MFFKTIKLKKIYLILFIIILVIIFSSILLYKAVLADDKTSNEDNDYIKWINFNATEKILLDTSKLDIQSHNENYEVKYNWIELLAYLAAQNGGDFKNFKKADLDYLVSRLNNGETMEDLTCDMKFYDYYYEAYSAVLSGFIGDYSIEVENSSR